MEVRKASCVGHHLPGHFCPFLFQPRYPSCWEVAALAEERKVAKYNGLPVTHSFTPVAIETLGAIGPKSLLFLKELGWRARRQSGDERAASFLLQRLSVAVQRGNAVSILGGLRGRAQGMTCRHSSFVININIKHYYYYYYYC